MDLCGDGSFPFQTHPQRKREANLLFMAFTEWRDKVSLKHCCESTTGQALPTPLGPRRGSVLSLSFCPARMPQGSCFLAVVWLCALLILLQRKIKKFKYILNLNYVRVHCRECSRGAVPVSGESAHFPMAALLQQRASETLLSLWGVPHLTSAQSCAPFSVLSTMLGVRGR